MKRRTLLGRTAAAGVALSLAGCLRRGRDDTVLEVSSTDFGGDDDGYLYFEATVSNPSGREAAGTLYVNSEIDDESFVRVREVELGPHSTETVRITYDVEYANVTNFEPSVDLTEE